MCAYWCGALGFLLGREFEAETATSGKKEGNVKLWVDAFAFFLQHVPVELRGSPSLI